MNFYMNCNNGKTYLGEVDTEFTNEKELLIFLKEQGVYLCREYYHNGDERFNKDRYTADELTYRQVKYSRYDKPFFINIDTIVKVTIIIERQQERIENFEKIYSFLMNELDLENMLNNKKVKKALYRKVLLDYRTFEAVGKLTKEIKKDTQKSLEYYLNILLHIFIEVNKKCNQEYFVRFADDLEKAGMFKTKEIKEKFLEILS